MGDGAGEVELPGDCDVVGHNIPGFRKVLEIAGAVRDNGVIVAFTFYPQCIDVGNRGNDFVIVSGACRVGYCESHDGEHRGQYPGVLSDSSVLYNVNNIYLKPILYIGSY